MSKLGFSAACVGLGILLFKLLLGTTKLLYFICKIAVLLPIAALFWLSKQAEIRSTPDGGATISRGTPAPPAAPVPDLGPASVDATGDWRKDRETLIRLLNEGKIK
jgi:hypothetical protein